MVESEFSIDATAELKRLRKKDDVDINLLIVASLLKAESIKNNFLFTYINIFQRNPENIIMDLKYSKYYIF